MTEARRLLVVDDEEALADMVSTALRFAGYDVRSVQSGFDAMRAVKAEEPHLLVLDVNLPDVDGFEVCRRLRRDGHTMPVIFLTARDGLDDLRTGFRQGGDDYLTKPFSLEELSLRIEALLRRSMGDRNAPRRIASGELIIDEDAHQVFVADEQAQLSPTEYRLLRYLMLNRDRVLSKDQILDYVWEYDFGGNAGIVETYVGYLRRKLGEAAGSRIQTVRGFGYVLRSPKQL
ncbi:MAG TPA: response regulator transcription factor [Acidimicrobiia bacterium]